MEDRFRYRIHKMSATPLFADDTIQARKIIQNLMQVQDAITQDFHYQFRHKADTLIVPEHLRPVNYGFHFPEEDIDRQLKKQGDKCFGCGQKLEPSDSLWFCQVTGYYFCEKCPCIVSQVPGAIRQLDFSSFVVSGMVAADIIADIDKPSVLTECLPQRIVRKRMF